MKSCTDSPNIFHDGTKIKTKPMIFNLLPLKTNCVLTKIAKSPPKFLLDGLYSLLYGHDFSGMLSVPGKKPDQSHDKHDDAQRIGEHCTQVECLFGYEEECRTDDCHKKSRYQRYDKWFLLLCQVDGQRPQGEH